MNPISENSYLRSLDDPEKYAGAPVSLQLVGRRYEDEKVSPSAQHKTIKLMLTKLVH